MRIIALSNRGISFQFRLPKKSFFCNTQSARFICVSVLFTIEVTKHELTTCFSHLTIQYTYLFKKEKMKMREFIPYRSPISRLSTLDIFLVHFQSQKFQPYTLFHSPRKHLRYTRGKVSRGRLDTT